MSSPSIIAEANSLSNSGGVGEERSSLRRLLLRGGLALAFAVGLERGLNFAANLLAARLAGPQVFGAYSIVLVTALTVATYAGAGMGTTANRFAGSFPRESEEYRGLLRAFLIVSFGSAALAAIILFAGAPFFAHYLLDNDGLTGHLRLAAFSSAAIILLECLRGFLIGRHKFTALLLLSLVSGLGLLTLLPAAAFYGNPATMIASQAAVGLAAIGVCLFFARRLGVAPLPSDRHSATPAPDGPSVRSVFSFGLVQLTAVIGLSIAGWWLTSLVARADTTLFQMGLYAVANQFRQLATIFPDLLSKVCYPLLADDSGAKYGGAERVMVLNTFVITALVLAVGGSTITLLPWALPRLYGRSYAEGEFACALLLATAIVHMSGTPAAHRANILAIRATSVINAIWAASLVVLGMIIVPRWKVSGAAAVFLGAHLISIVLVLIVLRRKNAAPREVVALQMLGLGGALTFVALAYGRTLQPDDAFGWSVMTGCFLLALMLTLTLYGFRRGWITFARRSGEFERGV